MLKFLSDWLNPQRRATSDPKRACYERKLLRFESLETRQLLSVNLGTIQNIEVPGTKTVLVPLTSVDSNNGAVSYTFSSSNPNVQLSLLSPASKSLKLHVQASNGATFSGDLVFKLFEDLTPVTTARIEDLVNQGYYNGLDFFRIIDGFVAQGGRASNPTTQQLDDEFNSSLTFTSRGLLAMANAGDDTGAAEFFITAIDATGSTSPITLANMPQHLNFQHSIFGQLVSGLDLFEQIMTVPVTSQNGETSDPTPQIAITSAQIITDTQDAVLKVVAPSGFSGSSTITVTAHGSDNQTAQQNFTATAVADQPQQPDPPFLNDSVPDRTVAVGKTVEFGMSSTNISGGGIFYDGILQNSAADLTKATITVDHVTGHVTITPAAGFIGSVTFLVGVQGNSNGTATSDFDSETFSVTWVTPTLDSVSNQTTALGTPKSVTLTESHDATAGLVFKVVDPTTFGTPANVSISVDQTTGQATITPNPGFTGTVNLRAAVRAESSPDVQASYSTQDFTLTILAPTLSAVGDSTVLKGQSTSRSLVATNPAGGGLVYGIVDASTLLPPANVTINVNQSTAEVTITPTVAGTFHLLARVRAQGSVDAPTNYTTQAFTVTAVGLDAVSDKTTTKNVPTSFTLTGTIPAGTQVVYSIVDPNTLGAPANVTVSIDQPTGHVTLTPAADFIGTISLLARRRAADAPDVADSYATEAFTLTSAQLNAVSDQSTAVGAPVSFTLTPNPAEGNVVYKVVDPDTFAAPTNVTVTINQSTGQVTLKPAAGVTGTINLRAAMRGADSADGKANYSTDDFTLTVSAPTLAEVSNQTVAKGVPSSFTLSATNPTGGGLVYNIVDATTLLAPANVTVTINQATGAVTLTSSAVGTYSLRARVRATGSDDVASNYTTQDFTFAVVAPTLEAVSNQTVVKGGSSSFTLTATNPAGGTLVYNLVDANTLTAPANVTININQETGAVTVTPTAAGAFNLLARVRATGSDDVAANYTTRAFTLTAVGLGTISNKTTQKDVATSFTLATVLTGSDVIVSIVDPATLLAPPNVTVAINQSNGQVTLTPAAGFTGTINLLARLRLTGSDDVPASYTTQAFTLTVTENPPDAPTNLAIDASSYTGPFDGNGYVSTDTIKLTVNATTGTTVKFKLGGVVIATATETAQGSGVFTATLAAGKLAIGTNLITATATNVVGEGDASTPLSVVYAPDYADGVYVVPGTPGTPQSLTFDWTVSNAGYKNEVGYFIADSADGSIGDIAPGEAGYAQAALNSSTRHVIFAKGQKAGASDTLDLVGGQVVVFYIIQNNTTANFLAKNPSNTLQDNNQVNAPMAFFSVEAANPDGKSHTQTIADPTTGRVQYNWEDLVGLGDSDFNDVVITVRLASQSVNPPALLRSPGAASTAVTLNGDFHSGKQIAPLGDVGVFFVDDPDGTIDGLHPGDPGYLAKALESGNFKVLVGAGSSSAQGITVPAGKYLAFYLITDGTTADFLTANPSNSTNGGPVALLSFDAANPSGTNHFRWYAPGTQATDPNIVQLHAMDKVSGGEGDFDAFTINLNFSSQSSS